MTTDTPGPSSPLVLIVEDDADTLDLYSHWLEYNGFRVEQATSAPEALFKAITHRPDVITTDLGNEDGLDGCRLAQSLKAAPDTNAIPVVAITGWSAASDVERALRAGCDAVLLKPCAPDMLLSEIRRLLDAKNAKGQ